MKFTKINLPFVVGVFLPFMAISAIVVWMRVSTVVTQPQLDFIYTKGPLHYRVEGKTIVKSQSRSGRQPDAYPQLYVYEVRTNESRKISFEEAERLSLLRVAPDGFSIRGGVYTKGFLPMFRETDTDYTKRFLVKGNLVVPIQVQLKGDSLDNFSLIGWIE